MAVQYDLSKGRIIILIHSEIDLESQLFKGLID